VEEGRGSYQALAVYRGAAVVTAALKAAVVVWQVGQGVFQGMGGGLLPLATLALALGLGLALPLPALPQALGRRLGAWQ